jgi:hypothetical protein
MSAPSSYISSRYLTKRRKNTNFFAKHVSLNYQILKYCMPVLSVDILFNAAVKLFLVEEHAISLTFTDQGIRIRFPTTRRLAEYLNVPHYYILPYYGMMEEQELVTREERVGIHTTNKGSMKIIRIMNEKFSGESSALLGPEIFRQICKFAEI